MRPLLRKRHPPVGSRPGTLVVSDTALPPVIGVVRYGPDHIEEFATSDATTLIDLKEEGAMIWIDVQGLGDEGVLRSIAQQFQIHPLALEDVVNTPQRPKVEQYSDHVLMLTRMVRPADNGAIVAEQVSLFVGKGYVISFQEQYGDVFDPVRARLRDAKGPMRSSGADYLAYALFDTIVDGYYPIIDTIGDALVNLELRITEHPTPRNLERLNRIKFEIINLQRSTAPQREALSRLLKDGSPFISEKVLVYLRDTWDHSAQISDALDSSREVALGLFNTYLSLVSNRTNEVMKVLTIMASIFIPLTFMAGLYGMNFDRMPELHSEWGYPILLAIMAVTAIALILYFRSKGWIGDGGDSDHQ